MRRVIRRPGTAPTARGNHGRSTSFAEPGSPGRRRGRVRCNPGWTLAGRTQRRSELLGCLDLLGPIQPPLGNRGPAVLVVCPPGPPRREPARHGGELVGGLAGRGGRLCRRVRRSAHRYAGKHAGPPAGESHHRAAGVRSGHWAGSWCTSSVRPGETGHQARPGDPYLGRRRRR